MINIAYINVVPKSIAPKVVQYAYRNCNYGDQYMAILASSVNPSAVWRVHNLPKAERSRVLRNFKNFLIDVTFNGPVVDVERMWRQLDAHNKIEVENQRRPIQIPYWSGANKYHRTKVEKAVYDLLKSGALDKEVGK